MDDRAEDDLGNFAGHDLATEAELWQKEKASSCPRAALPAKRVPAPSPAVRDWAAAMRQLRTAATAPPHAKCD